MERFLRAESSGQENRQIIRHLLADCELCHRTAREAARRQGFTVPVEPVSVPLLRIAG
jgi:hypothetical protein